MKIALRNPVTDMYLLGPDRWTKEPAKALHFERADHALEHARKVGLKDLELAVSFSGGIFDLRMPLPQSQSQSV